MTDKLATIAIKGKNYVTVNTRVEALRQTFKGYSIITEPKEITDDAAVFKAEILDENRNIIATGWAREERTAKGSMVNLTSYVENCETSAVGRALGFLGIGINESIASFDEVATAIARQEGMVGNPIEQMITPAQEQELDELGVDKAALCAIKKVPSIKALTADQAQWAINKKKSQQRSAA